MSVPRNNYTKKKKINKQLTTVYLAIILKNTIDINLCGTDHKIMIDS